MTRTKSGMLEVLILDISQIVQGPNIRREVNVDGLKESIHEAGLVNPIAVRRLGNGMYETISGARRLEAAKQAGLTRVTAVIHEVDETTRLLMQIAENLQREDLTPLEKAEAISRYHSLTDMGPRELAKKLGLSQNFIDEALTVASRLTDDEKADLKSMTQQPSMTVLRVAAHTKLPKQRKEMLAGHYSPDEAKRIRRYEPGVHSRGFRIRIPVGNATVRMIFNSKRVTKREVVDKLGIARVKVADMSQWPPKPTPARKKR